MAEALWLLAAFGAGYGAAWFLVAGCCFVSSIIKKSRKEL